MEEAFAFLPINLFSLIHKKGTLRKHFPADLGQVPYVPLRLRQMPLWIIHFQSFIFFPRGILDFLASVACPWSTLRLEVFFTAMFAKTFAMFARVFLASVACPWSTLRLD